MERIKKSILTKPLSAKDKVYSNFAKRVSLSRLEKYAPEINFVLTSYSRKCAEETMMIKGFRKSNQETTNRKSHAENLSTISHLIAKGINEKNRVFKYNYEVLDIMSKNHDIGHTFLGHSGEWWLSNIKEDYGIGYYVHNALGPRELIYTDGIYDKIIETIKQRHPGISDKTLNRIRKDLWIIMEGINSHNGERSEREYFPDLTKTEANFEEENLKCHTIKGFDKSITPATPEAALMRICDKISYIPYDMVDGLREGFIKGLDEEYRSVLRELGITDEEIEICAAKNNYEDLARKLQLIFINDVITNSSGTTIRMSPEVSKLMHELRNINNRQIVNYVVLKEDNETYPPALRAMINEFKGIVIEEDIISELEKGKIPEERRKELLEKYKDTPNIGFVEYVLNTNPEDFAYTKRIVTEATKQGILDEQAKAREIARKKMPLVFPSNDFSLRDNRVSAYVGYYLNKNNLDNYSDEDKNKDLESVLRNIQSPTKSNKYFLKMPERFALEFGAKYLATLNDIEFMELLRAKGFVNDQQFASLTRKYKDIKDLHGESEMQDNWKKISKAQVIDTK